MTGRPEILVEDPRMIWCDRHLEPLRADWPAGYLPASICLLHQAVLRDDVQAAAGGQADSLGAVLREWGPLCCLLDEETVTEITRLALDPGGIAELLRRYGPPPTRAAG